MPKLLSVMNMGFIGRDDTGDPTNYDFGITAANTGTNFTFQNDTSIAGSALTIPTLFYCGHCPRRFSTEQDYDFHIIWHMLDTIITEFRASRKKIHSPHLPKLPIPKKRNWWGKLKDIEGNANLTT